MRAHIKNNMLKGVVYTCTASSCGRFDTDSEK